MFYILKIAQGFANVLVVNKISTKVLSMHSMMTY